LTPFVGDLGPPWFIKAAPDHQFIAWPASSDLKLRCRADGEPPLKYQWLKDGKVLKYRRLDPKYVFIDKLFLDNLGDHCSGKENWIEYFWELCKKTKPKS
jgi:hypothetical protein